MKSYVTIALSLLLFACGSQQNAQTSSGENATGMQQGIRGQVVWVEGNQMPGIVDDNTTDTPTADGQKVSRTVYVYELTDDSQAIRQNGFYTEIQTPMIKEVHTSDDGSFEVELQPGTYSVFVKEPDGLFANMFDGEGHINPVKVSQDSISQLTLRVDYKAAY